MGKTELRIEIDADLVARAEAGGIDIARTLEKELRRVVADGNDDTKATRWREDNREALSAQRERLDASGVFGSDLQTW
jgi:post-segregation antitoxin (ccd killing protein)